MIDSHCHLADPKFIPDLKQVIERAKQAGIEKMICIADSLPEAKRCIQIASDHQEIFATAGVHPHNAKDWKESDTEEIRLLIASSNKVKAVGEIGLDYHYDLSPREKQKEVFKMQLDLAKELQLPVVVHNRESISDLLTIINGAKPGKLVLHCCTDTFEDVKPLLNAGYFLSFTGIATYPNVGDIRNTIKQCPLDQMMIETDAPYLAPVPHRGKRNEPAFVKEVAKLIAEIKELSLEEIDAQTTKNTIEFFGLDS